MSNQPSQDLYERLEAETANAFEELVGTRGFGWVFARSAENLAAVVRISADVSDLVLRNLRLAGRADVTRLARQLHRTEDKLERVLQEVEALRDELEDRPPAAKPENGASARTIVRNRSGAQP
jgi:hypothetical protein